MAVDLNSYAAAGTRLWYSATFKVGILKTGGGALQAVVSDLDTNWNMNVESSTYSLGIVSDDAIQMIVTLQNDYSRIQDVLDVINGSFANTVGATVTGAAFTKIQPVNTSTPIPTGSPDPGAAANPSEKKSPFDFSLSATGWVTLGIVALGAILIAAVIVSPGTPAHVARAFSR